MADWIKINSLDELQVGDIFETPSKFPSNHSLFPDVQVPLIKHYGMIVMVKDENGKDVKAVVHNTIYGKPHIDPIDKVITPNRPIERILRTNIPNDVIMQRYSECQNDAYEFWGQNCEKFVERLCGCSIGMDQRVGWFGGLGILIIIGVIVFLWLRKKNK